MGPEKDLESQQMVPKEPFSWSPSLRGFRSLNSQKKHLHTKDDRLDYIAEVFEVFTLT